MTPIARARLWRRAPVCPQTALSASTTDGAEIPVRQEEQVPASHGHFGLTAPRLEQASWLRGSNGDEAATRGEARDQLVWVGRRLRSRFITGDRLLRSC